MTIPTTAISETTPAGDSNIALGDNRIREYKVQNREILEIDHVYPSSGQDATAGKHKKASFIEQADLGTGAEGLPILGAQTVSGKAELVFTDEDDNDIQITSGGDIRAAASILNAVYPIGIVVTLGVSTNPGTLFGVGTWTAIEGRVIVGKAASGTFDTLDETMGAETHTLTVDEMPAHAHGGVPAAAQGAAAGNNVVETKCLTSTKTTDSVPSQGGGQAHNNIQPTIVKYIWQRTS